MFRASWWVSERDKDPESDKKQSNEIHQTSMCKVIKCYFKVILFILISYCINQWNYNANICIWFELKMSWGTELWVRRSLAKLYASDRKKTKNQFNSHMKCERKKEETIFVCAEQKWDPLLITIISVYYFVFAFCLF